MDQFSKVTVLPTKIHFGETSYDENYNVIAVNSNSWSILSRLSPFTNKYELCFLYYDELGVESLVSYLSPPNPSLLSLRK